MIPIIIGLIALAFFNIHPVLVIILSGLYGLIFLRKQVEGYGDIN